MYANETYKAIAHPYARHAHRTHFYNYKHRASGIIL